ncbi:hypothetical protein DYE48_07955 [Halobacillus trueperi]|uniref:Uncharacterized protein n=1 Tax=Halobacillus trueperi TaxID=156205 RepID=A0A3E0J9B6_9BACI|nr:hypothetical protein DYE48_07955 [Halobacillus trueperi]
MEDAPIVWGSFLTYIEWGGWKATRLPWEKEIGEIPQDAVRGSSALPHRKASSFPATPDCYYSNEPWLSRNQTFNNPAVYFNN